MMGIRNNNVGRDSIQEIYATMIEDFDYKGRDSSPLRERLNQLELKNKKKDKLTVAVDLLRDVISDVEDFQDKYGMSTNLYYTIKEFLNG